MLISIVFWLLVFSSKDILMRVVSQNLSPELTLVEKVWLLISLVLQLVDHMLNFSEHSINIWSLSLQFLISFMNLPLHPKFNSDYMCFCYDPLRVEVKVILFVPCSFLFHWLVVGHASLTFFLIIVRHVSFDLLFFCGNWITR